MPARQSHRRTRCQQPFPKLPSPSWHPGRKVFKNNRMLHPGMRKFSTDSIVLLMQKPKALGSGSRDSRPSGTVGKSPSQARESLGPPGASSTDQTTTAVQVSTDTKKTSR
eukprot:scaffold153854_cov28-Prasinocladus_malaysianus.AAC.1